VAIVSVLPRTRKSSASFLEWDTGCFEKLKGMFAVALWQEAEDGLILAETEWDQAALLSIRQGEIYFGSEMKVSSPILRYHERSISCA